MDRTGCDFNTGAGCSTEVRRLIAIDKPLESPGLADPLMLVGGGQKGGADVARRAVGGKIAGYTKHGLNRSDITGRCWREPKGHTRRSERTD